MSIVAYNLLPCDREQDYLMPPSLKEWLYRKRTLARQDGDRTERRERKEAEAARIETEQPALFSF